MIEDKILSDTFERKISSFEYPSEFSGLYYPVEYTLASGGKRMRPLLCMRACEAFGENPLDAVNQALAIEMFHNFTLIHDDVMDRSDTRRGRPTVFARWGATQAILSGDALLTMATQRIMECRPEKLPTILALFNKTALEVYEGQQLDIEFETRDDVTTDEYLEMIRLKTSVLLGCACALGVLVALDKDEKKAAEALYRYGERLGVAFQLRDDWLDTFGDPDIFGKPIGGDIRNRKKTWLFITAMSEAPTEMKQALNQDDETVVESVKGVYDRLKLSERCDEMIRRYCNEAIGALDNAEITDESRQWFAQLAIKLCNRDK